MSATFALLDDAGIQAAPSSSNPSAAKQGTHARLLRELVCELRCTQHTEFPQLLAQMQQYLDAGRYAILLLSYELGAAMQDVAAWPDIHGQIPLARALIFQDLTILDQNQLDAWLEQQATQSAAAGIAELRADTDQSRFCQALDKIADYIAAGHTYQVNYTYRLRFSVYGGALALYRRLRQRQPVPYGALIQLPDGSSVVSLSPELFVRHSQGKLFAQPMKGTAPASDDAEENQRRAEALAQDPKNRAENLMIVDLLRNDMGRIAQAGTVDVAKLFDVRQFSRVLQMTSSITAQLAPDIDLPAIMQALYPCGSITGAPKRRTMEIIRELESAPRGIYTGAIGWFAPPATGTQPTQAIGDFCLSVPIRTMLLQPEQENGLCAAEMGVGAGIVYDSQSAEEFQECQLKAGFLTGLQAPLALFETMAASREQACPLLPYHLQRLEKSCAWFGIPFARTSIEEQLAALCASLPAQQTYRLKLSIAGDGSITLEHAPLAPLQGTQYLIVSNAVNQSPVFLLGHKTSLRQQYDAAWQAAEKLGAFDQLFCNAQGKITEGGRSNIFVQLDGHWYTPPLSDGLLPGVMRAQLLQDHAWQAQERSMDVTDLRRASALVLCNALRGVIPVSLRWDAENLPSA